MARAYLSFEILLGQLKLKIPYDQTSFKNVEIHPSFGLSPPFLVRVLGDIGKRTSNFAYHEIRFRSKGQRFAND